MYRQRFYEIVDEVHTSLDDKYPPEMEQHMAHIEQFLKGNDDSKYMSNVYGQHF